MNDRWVQTIHNINFIKFLWNDASLSILGILTVSDTENIPFKIYDNLFFDNLCVN